MHTLLTNLVTLPDRHIPDQRWHSSISLTQTMSRRHTCPCCSNVLLRHVGRGKLYWRCNHCYQAMPVLNSPRDISHVVHRQQPVALLSYEQRKIA